MTRELGTGTLPQPIAAVIDAEFETARERWLNEPARPGPDTIAAADELLRRWVLR